MKIFEIIHASCKGIKQDALPYQDYLMVEDNENCLIATLSDGLGSSKYSSEGAQIACQVIVDYFKSTSNQQVVVNSMNECLLLSWEKRVRGKSNIIADFRTTNSFVVVLKDEKRVIVGQIGDSLVAYKIDEGMVKMSVSDKDFLNETDCLGGRKTSRYELTEYQYHNDFTFLIASDGFGDELISDKMDLLFDYFKTKYCKISRKNRNYELKKEIKQFLNEKNDDDKSVIFVWTK
jgi:serine/threonine protein phosphatase PrpC